MVQDGGCLCWRGTFRLRNKKNHESTDRVSNSPESTRNENMMCQHVRGERLNRVRRFGPHPRLSRSSRRLVSRVNAPRRHPSSSCPCFCAFVSLSCFASDVCCIVFVVVVMAVVALVAILSACFCGFASGRGDVCCRPLSSPCACFLGAFCPRRGLHYFFCTAPVAALLARCCLFVFGASFACPLCTSLCAVSPFTVRARLFVSSSEAPAAVADECCF